MLLSLPGLNADGKKKEAECIVKIDLFKAAFAEYETWWK